VKREKMLKQTKISAILLMLIMALSISAFVMPVIAKDPPHTPAGSASITIDNGIINITDFGETYSYGWYYRGDDHTCWEEPLMSYGTNDPVFLPDGCVSHLYPDSGVTDTWYDAFIELDLDGDNTADINVSRSIQVPSGEQYFLVRYRIENINGSALDNFRVFEGVDYDVCENINDEGGYNNTDDDFVWAHDLGGSGVCVGFTGDRSSANHEVSSHSTMWSHLASGSLNNANNYDGDVGVGMEWDFGTLHDGQQVELIVKFAFANSCSELEDILAPATPVTVESALEPGTPHDTFQIGDPVYAIGSGYAAGTGYNLYILKDQEWIGDGTESLAGAVITTPVTTNTSGSIAAGTQIWDSCVKGTYDIVVDVDGNGYYDAAIDALDSNMDVGFEGIPEFSTIAIPVASILGLLFFFNHRKRRKE
jgi:hypothetical protein